MPDAAAQSVGRPELFYRFDHLDALMDEAGIDVLVASSPHNVGYLVGHYEFSYFSAMEALGESRHWPAFVYARGRPDETLYVGNRIESETHAATPFWTPHVVAQGWTAWENADTVVDHLRRHGHATARVGFELPFLPIEVAERIGRDLPHIERRDATRMLHLLRMVKHSDELVLLREGSERIVDAIAETIRDSSEGTTKVDLNDRLRRAVQSRDVRFGYALVTFGASHNRALFSRTLADGEAISVDCGSDRAGYIADVTRMGSPSEPDAELEDLLGRVERVQQAAFARIRPGAPGSAFIRAADAVLPQDVPSEFSAHGMGLVAHEAPFLMTNRPVTYEGVDSERPLEAGMVLSVETTMKHPRGLIKLEDTVAVTADGCEIYGGERGWIVAEGASA